MYNLRQGSRGVADSDGQRQSAAVTGAVVAIGALGGTISMTDSADGTGLVPSKTAEDLLARVSPKGGVTYRPTTLASKPGASLDTQDIARTIDWALSAADGGATAVVVTTGTDTLEEVAYAVSLYWDRPIPLVFTAAMRASGQASSDAEANLTAAVQTAMSGTAAAHGPLVVIDDEIHDPRWIQKLDTLSLGSFASSGVGPLGRVVEAEPVFFNRRNRPAPLRVKTAADPDVRIVATYLGDRGEQILGAVRSGADAIVIAALGAGHVAEAVADRAGELATTLPIVFAAAAPSGPTAARTYGFPGSEHDMLARGLLSAGWLRPKAARWTLWALLRAGLAHDRLALAFASHAAMANDTTPAGQGRSRS